jgi:hypothetical protein
MASPQYRNGGWVRRVRPAAYRREYLANDPRSTGREKHNALPNSHRPPTTKEDGLPEFEVVTYVSGISEVLKFLVRFL